ncbi:MAG: hypothetical protein SGI92_23160, partial [Bryobacteraceae bacterium]|nr:hypothetical protein [Bryobacteraceae bacterium]
IGYGPRGGDFGGEVSGSYRGVGGAKGGAMLAGGSILAMDGLRRGGLIGLGETTAGGALIGAKFGGPVGAAIGAGIGAAAGIARLFVKGAEEKARQKIRDVYDVDVKDKALLKLVVETARSRGGLDVAIQTKEVRELIELYALSTGQNTNRLPAAMKPLGLVQQGGTLFSQSPGSSRLDSIQSGTKSNAGPVVIQSLTLQVDGQSAADLLEGRIADNPRLVQSAVLNATKSNYGRREMAAQTLSPGLLTA